MPKPRFAKGMIKVPNNGSSILVKEDKLAQSMSQSSDKTGKNTGK